VSVKLPLLVDSAIEANALAREASAPWARVAPAARPIAARAWLALIGSPGEDAPARFACALSSALGEHARYALLSAGAPAALASALQQCGAEALRCTPFVDATALDACIACAPEGAIVLVVESELASHRRGLLDVWVGPAPALGSDPQLAQLYRAADVRVPANADSVAHALGEALGPALGIALASRLAARASSYQ
jgi:hypothetical protein